MCVGFNHCVLLFEDGYGNDLSVFDSDSLQGIRRVEIGNDCLKNVLDLWLMDWMNWKLWSLERGALNSMRRIRMEANVW